MHCEIKVGITIENYWEWEKQTSLEDDIYWVACYLQVTKLQISSKLTERRGRVELPLKQRFGLP